MLDIGKRLILALFILPLRYELNNCERNFGINMYYMNYTAGPKYNFSVFNYKFYNVDNKMIVYVEFELYDSGNFTLHIKIDMLRANNNKMNLLDIEQDGCKLLNGVHKSRMLKIMVGKIIRVVNLPAKCPILANKRYIVNNYTLGAESFPTFMPSMHWIIETKFMLNKNYVGNMIVQGNFFKLKTDATQLKT